MGALFFCAVFGTALLDPAYTDWLMLTDDPALQYLGAKFFASTPWHLPPGIIPEYGAPAGTAVSYTDSLPWLAFMHKALRAHVPPSFQYFGWWVLCCYCAQGALAMALLARLGARGVSRVAGAFLLISSPVLLWRWDLQHHALMGQWVLLAAAWLYLQPRHRVVRWTILLALCAGINFYLLAMVMAFLAADMLRRFVRDGRAGVPFLLRAAGCYAVATGVCMWLTGYFSVPGITLGRWGFGVYSANAASLVDPVGTSLFFRWQAAGGGQYEGYGYLGLGMIFCVCFALAVPSSAAALKKVLRAHWPLALSAAFCGIFSLSNEIYFGNLLLLRWNVVPWASWLTEVLRASGRFIWVPYYCIFIGAFALLLRTRARKAVAGIMLAAAFLQAADFSWWWMFGVRPQASVRRVWKNSLQDPRWQEWGRQYARMVVLPFCAEPFWDVSCTMPAKDLIAFAADHGLAINISAAGRSSGRQEQLMRQEELDLSRGQVRRDALYVLDEAFARGVPQDLGEMVAVDGVTVLLPVKHRRGVND